MRCVCCDRGLNDHDVSVRYKSTGDYADMCHACRSEISDDVEFLGRSDIEPDEQVDEEDITFVDEEDDG